MISLTLPFPPSVNTYWRIFGNRMIISEKGRTFRSAAVAAIVAQMPAGFREIDHDVAVKVMLMAPDRRRRDLDNYQKAVFDSLTHAGFWEDDNQIKRFCVEWGDNTKGGLCTVEVEKFEK